MWNFEIAFDNNVTGLCIFCQYLGAYTTMIDKDFDLIVTQGYVCLPCRWQLFAPYLLSHKTGNLF